MRTGEDIVVPTGVKHEPYNDNETRAHIQQRESTATIKAGAKPYAQVEPAKPQNILEFDCRGLEFVEFKPEVSPGPEHKPQSSTEYTVTDRTGRLAGRGR